MKPVVEATGTGLGERTVTVRHRGGGTLSMAGWVLRNDTGKTWKLDSLVALDPGESKPVQRKGMAMNLKDNGDTVSLIAPNGSKKDEYHYVLIATGH